MATSSGSNDVLAPKSNVAIETNTGSNVLSVNYTSGEVSTSGGNIAVQESEKLNNSSTQNDAICINKKFVRHKDGSELVPGTTYLVLDPNGLQKKMLFNGENFVEPPCKICSDQDSESLKNSSTQNTEYCINKKFVRPKDGGELIPGTTYLLSGPNGLEKKMKFNGENFVEPPGKICSDKDSGGLKNSSTQNAKYCINKKFVKPKDGGELVPGSTYLLSGPNGLEKKMLFNGENFVEPPGERLCPGIAPDGSVIGDGLKLKALTGKDVGSTTTRLMDILPAELLVMIFSFLSHHNIVSTVRNVCARWRELATNPSLWRTVKFSDEFTFNNYNVGFLKEILGKVGPYIQTVAFDNQNSFGTFIDEIECLSFDSLKEFDLSNCECRKFHDEGSFDGMFGDLRFPKLQCVSTFAMVQYIEQFVDAFHDEKFRKMSLNFRKPLYYISQQYPEDIFNFNSCMIEIIKNQPDLEEVCLHCFVMEDRTVEFLLNHCISLRLLSLNRCTKLTDGCFQHLSVSNTLVDVSLDGTNISDKVVEKVCVQCPSLKSLSLYRCFKVTENSLAFVASNCKSLECFIFSGIKRIRDRENNQSLKLLENLGNLKYLHQKNVCSIPVNDIAISGLVNCLNLVEIELNLCRLLTDNALVTMAQTLKKLRTIQFGQCAKITSVGVQAIMMGCWLKVLTIDGCKSLADLSFPEQKDNMHSHIQELSLAKTKMSDAALKNVVAMCPDLRRINLHCAQGISNVSLEILMKECQFLVDLDISDINTDRCHGITDKTITLIVQHLPNIRCLKISGYPNQYVITLNGWNRLTQGCSSLVQLEFSSDVTERKGLNLNDIYNIKLIMKKTCKKFKFKMNDAGFVCVLWK